MRWWRPACCPVAASAQSVAEKLGIRYVFAAYCPIVLPSPHQPPLPLPGRPLPPDVTDNRVLKDLDAERVQRAVRRRRSTPSGRRSACRRWTTSATTSSPTIRGWRRTRSWAPGRSRRTSTSCRPARGSCRTNARSRPSWRRSWTPAHRRCTWASAACAPRRTPPGWPSRRSARRAAAQLVARGWADLAPIDDRDDCFAVGEVNQQALFGRVAAVVHHGGAGTTTTAARAGAPQVVIPQMADQPYWAGRVADLGIGAAHDGPTPTTESLSAALGTALTPQTRARATAVAGHDPHRRGDGGCDAADRRDQPDRGGSELMP